MPAVYAHTRFGGRVLEKLPEEAGDIVRQEREIYNIGLQGPDILFYYHPLQRNDVNRMGEALHAESGRQFFGRVLKHMEEDGTPDEKKARKAYVYGMLCHFALDSTCHAYINPAVTMEASHSAIEGDFDRALLARDGLVPEAADTVRDFRPDERTALLITPFYEGLDLKTVRRSMALYRFYHRALRCPGRFKREFIYGGLKIRGFYHSLRGHIVCPEPDPLCRETTEKLFLLFEEAVPAAAELIAGFPDNLGDPRFDFNFSGERVENTGL